MPRFASCRPSWAISCPGPFHPLRWVSRLVWVTAILTRLSAPSWAQESDDGTLDLKLEELRQWVLERNENVHMRMLEVEISEKVYKAERGIFEPQVVGSVEHIDTDRPNNTQQQASLGLFGPSTPVFLEENTLYNAGIEFLLPTGTRLRSGFTLRDLSNNLQYSGSGTNRTFTGPEYEIFVGATIVQPLLKNFGLGPTMAKIRLAALASEVAFQEYRRQLMLMLAQAESAYWELYLAQERARIAQDSVTLSGKILADNKARLEVGKAPELEVLQAEAGVSLRKARLNESRQRIFEVASRISNLYGRTPRQSPARPRASDEPVQLEYSANREDDILQAFASNPDFRMRQTQLEQEGIRVKYTRNQRLPQLDVRGSYGLNSLGRAVGEAWDDVDSQDYPAWSVAVEMRFPIGGGSKERNEHQAAKIAKERAQVAIREVETQVLNGIDSARRRLQLYAEDVQNYRSVSSFHERLLQTQLDRLAVGGIESVVVLETEEKLSEARTAVVEGLVLYRRSLLELELIRGTLLKARQIEVDRDQLRSATRKRLLQSNISVSRAAEMEKKAAAEIDQLAAQR
ncbi:MAG: TolC family protein [Verrucomicrobiales bacterium]|nr:TolC family protein [Verrucomicrobiales bacterium]